MVSFRAWYLLTVVSVVVVSEEVLALLRLTKESSWCWVAIQERRRNNELFKGGVPWAELILDVTRGAAEIHCRSHKRG